MTSRRLSLCVTPLYMLQRPVTDLFRLGPEQMLRDASLEANHGRSVGVPKRHPGPELV